MGKVAAELGGGGHPFAAGATVDGTIEEATELALALVEREVMDYSIKGRPGIINVYKEKGYTSFDVVAVLRKFFGKRVGHTGTLDPQAEGVLPICIGRATKLADYLTAAEKTYVAEVVLGKITNTGDLTGEVISEKEVTCSREEITKVVESFKFENRGEYLQTPPMYSAIKINGKKLYELARKGKVIDRPARPKKIFDIRILEFLEDRFVIEVTCSKGTYIRSLCEDIGEALGCGATMGALTRTHSGLFSAATAFKLDDIKAAAEDSSLPGMVLDVDRVLPFPSFAIKNEAITAAENGNAVPLDMVEGKIEINAGDKCWIKGRNRIIGLYRRDGNKLKLEVKL